MIARGHDVSGQPEVAARRAAWLGNLWRSDVRGVRRPTSNEAFFISNMFKTPLIDLDSMEPVVDWNMLGTTTTLEHGRGTLISTILLVSSSTTNKKLLATRASLLVTRVYYMVYITTSS